MQINLSKYIGTPYVKYGRDIETGLDCYGLIVHIYKQEFNLELDPLTNLTTQQGFKSASERLRKTDIYKEFEPVLHEMKLGDIILISFAGNPLHVGMAIDNNRMIHSNENIDCVIEDIRGTLWQNRIHKILRHPSLS